MKIQLETRQPVQAAVTPSGVLYVASAGFLWGIYCIFYKGFPDIEAYQIAAFRAIGSFIFLSLFVLPNNGWSKVSGILKSGNLFALTSSAFFLGMHVILYIFAIQKGRVMECSAGMFLSYIASMILGLIVFRERYQLLNWLALIFGVAATALLTSNAEDFPWFAVGIGLTWAFYGLARKKASANAEPIVQTLVEMALLAVPSAIYLLCFANLETVNNLPELNRLWLILGCGATAIPSVLYGEGAKRLPLSALGLFHSLSPSIQFLLAIFVYHEVASPLKMQAFGLLWLALALYSYQQWKRSYN
ncbi:EamA family transporter [Phormidium nigroviride]